MNLRYTITRCSLIGENKRCDVQFALIFEENGVFFLETFLDKDFYEDTDFSRRFNLKGITEDENLIELIDLTFTYYSEDNCKAKFVCRNHLKLTESSRDSPEEDSDGDEDSIFFVELEGFHTKFADLTRITKRRGYGKEDSFPNSDFDHTSCALFVQIKGFEENYFHLIFSKSRTNDTIQINFTETGGYGLLTLDHYGALKKQLLGFLSLLNGADVAIRRELTGKYYEVSGSAAHIVYHYSFSKLSNPGPSDYIPINEHHSYSTPIFHQAFLYCFNEFYHNDQKFDFYSIISSINTAHATPGIREAYSILINALEKFCANYYKSINTINESLMDNENWEKKIKTSLLKVLEENKPLINSNNKKVFEIFKSKIGNLNRKESGTIQKMYDLFEFGCIPINENVKKLITIERHTAVHKGEFGKNSKEMHMNYYKLDHILRDLILNIIDYRSYRNSIHEYATPEERRQAYPKRKREPVTYICSQPIRH